jgi:hypothetical protein
MSLCVDDRLRSMSGSNVFELPSVEIGGTPTMDSCRRASIVWEQIVPFLRSPTCLKRAKEHAWQVLFHSCAIAVEIAGCVRFRRNRRHAKQVLMHVIEAAKEAGLIIVIYSKPGGIHSSRLAPTDKLRPYLPVGGDPWIFDPPTDRQFVKMKLPNDKERRLRNCDRDLEFNANHPIALEYQQRLRIVNSVIANYRIMGTPAFDPYRLGERRLRPVHIAIFHPNWQHARLYTLGPYGHTSLRKSERPTITFNGESSAELDFAALHPRMLYHLCGLDFRDDPYALWGDVPMTAQRDIAKFVLNSAINAKNVLLACHAKASLMERRGNKSRPKTGRDLKNARKIQAQLDETGLTFRAVLDLVREVHKPIASYFGTGAGAELMRLDSVIALDVMYRFARRGIPILGVHDSFIVPKSWHDELKYVMEECYQLRLGGFYPVVK